MGIREWGQRIRKSKGDGMIIIKTTFTGKNLQGQEVTVTQDAAHAFSTHHRGGAEDYNSVSQDRWGAEQTHDALVKALLQDCPMCTAVRQEVNAPQEQHSLL